MSGDQTYEGGCLCGAVRYRATGGPIRVAHCHCEWCRRHTGAVFATGVGFPAEAVAWTHEQPTLYRSSENASRGFCPRCGSSVSFHWLDIGTIWVFVGTLDHPEEVTPELHVFTESQIPWVKLDDGLPRHSRFPPERAGKEGADLIRREVRPVVDKVLEMGDGDVAVGTVRAFEAGVLDIPWSPNRFVKSRVLPARDVDGYLRIFDPAAMPMPKEVLEFHEERLRRRAEREGRPYDHELAVTSVYEISEPLSTLSPFPWPKD